jgi:hypothetical protein
MYNDETELECGGFAINDNHYLENHGCPLNGGAPFQFECIDSTATINNYDTV